MSTRSSFARRNRARASRKNFTTLIPPKTIGTSNSASTRNGKIKKAASTRNPANHEKIEARIVKSRSCAVSLRCTLRCVFQTPKSTIASNR